MARRPSAEPALRAEHRVLEQLWRDRPLGIGDTLPQPLLLENLGGRLVLATTALPGGPMSVGYYRPGHARQPRSVRRDFELAGTWLSRFQRDTWRGQLVVGRETFEETVLPVFDRYQAAVGWSRWEQDLLDQLARRCADLSGAAVPLVAVHGDYALGNILLSDNVVTGVVDWELGQAIGLPFTDLFKFVSSYGSFLDRAIPPRRRTSPGPPGLGGGGGALGRPGNLAEPGRSPPRVLRHGWFPDLVREFLRDHLARLGTAPEAMTLFLPLFVAEQAMALDNPEYRAGYRSVLEALWQDTDMRWARGLAGAR